MDSNKVWWSIYFDHLDNKAIKKMNMPVADFLGVVKSGGIIRKFRLYDDDSELYFTGEMVCENGSDPVNSPDIFAPLDDYGMPDSGCTSIEVLEERGWRVI